MDSDTAQLALKLLIEDVEDVVARQKGKQKAGHFTDSEIASNETLKVLQTQLQLLEDRHIAESIDCACQTDSETIREALAIEEQAVRDHELACRVAGQRQPPRTGQHTNMVENGGVSEARFLTKDHQQSKTRSSAEKPSLAEINSLFSLLFDTEQVRDEAESSRSIATRLQTTPECDRAICSVCTTSTPVQDTIQLNCEPEPHTYCQSCIEDLFRRATTDETLFPPRCCRKVIPAESAQLPNDLFETFHEKSIEFSTPNRLYCFKPTCSTFIHPENVTGAVGICPKCGSGTCAQCKKGKHDGDCPEDPAVQKLLNLAASEGWRQCSNCKWMVELTVGCYHIR